MLSVTTIASECESYLSATQARLPVTEPTFPVTRPPEFTSIVGDAAVAIFHHGMRFNVCTYSDGSANQLAFDQTLSRFTGRLQFVGTVYLSSTQGWALIHYGSSVKRIALVTAGGEVATNQLRDGLALLTFQFPYKDLHKPYESNTYVGVAVGFNFDGREVASTPVTITWNFPLGGFESGPVPSY